MLNRAVGERSRETKLRSLGSDIQVDGIGEPHHNAPVVGHHRARNTETIGDLGNGPPGRDKLANLLLGKWRNRGVLIGLGATCENNRNQAKCWYFHKVCVSQLTQNTEPPPGDANRDSGTASCNGCWLRQSNRPQ